MRLLILILLFPFIAQGQIVRTHPYYKPAVITSSCIYLLDTYTGSRIAHSVAFKLNSSYSGPAYRVRESGSNTEQDIGFVGCVVDTASLKSFVGSNSGYVVTLYDQSGNGYNATQSTSSLQARVVNAGTVERLNSQPTMYFNANSYNFVQLGAQSRVDLYFLASTSDATYIHFTTAPAYYTFVAQDGSSSTGILGLIGTPTLYANTSTFGGTTRNDVHDFLTGTKIVCIENASPTGWTGGMAFGNYSGFEYTGYMSQIVAWITDQSANRSGIISAFNTQFSVY